MGNKKKEIKTKVTFDCESKPPFIKIEVEGYKLHHYKLDEPSTRKFIVTGIFQKRKSAK